MKSTLKPSLAVVGLFSLAMTLQGAWTLKRLTNNSGSSLSPDTAVWGANVYAVWSDDSTGNNEIYFKRSTDGCATWQPTRKLTNNGEESLSPVIAVSGANAYVVWSDRAPGNYDLYFRKSTDGGATWQAAKRLSNNSGSSGSPDLAVSGSSLYVVWSDDTPNFYGEIYFRKSTDGGATWQTAIRLTDNLDHSWNPAVAVGDSLVFVTWEDDAPGNFDIFYRKSTDGGATWPAAKKIVGSAGDSAVSDVAIVGSNVYVAWYEKTANYEIMIRKSTDEGATWQPKTNLSNNAGNSFVPRIAVNGSNVFVVWQDYTPHASGEAYFRKSMNGGGVWQAVTRLTDNEGATFAPVIAANSSNVYVAWYDNSPGNYEVYLKFSPY